VALKSSSQDLHRYNLLNCSYIGAPTRSSQEVPPNRRLRGLGTDGHRSVRNRAGHHDRTPVACRHRNCSLGQGPQSSTRRFAAVLKTACPGRWAASPLRVTTQKWGRCSLCCRKRLPTYTPRRSAKGGRDHHLGRAHLQPSPPETPTPVEFELASHNRYLKVALSPLPPSTRALADP
jgi:hypothetical protein